ncbi:photosystem I reaction center subunit X [Crocosphaera subtropica ATCC 51142]|uniref:Photosystem I reaction center subunit PsaK n=1 Tax=Crocosphaera subtropica (strain ATCC 51142 / BH68) TaxID=43989 RepID=B1WT20_CROS5|nr:photosystem I reaction center subunit PsaK [Crocosphaera subtropica]ACB50350.1 photosystem I reaction center subunit X [Crocosphaera subtropica ATCC 51142]
MLSNIIILAEATSALTTPWNLSVGMIMITANLFSFILGYFAIQKTGAGPELPLPQLASKKKFGLPELLATASFGHIIGAGIILGLSNAGLL